MTTTKKLTISEIRAMVKAAFPAARLTATYGGGHWSSPRAEAMFERLMLSNGYADVSAE